MDVDRKRLIQSIGEDQPFERLLLAERGRPEIGRRVARVSRPGPVKAVNELS
jgi:hypothetical protein